MTSYIDRLVLLAEDKLAESRAAAAAMRGAGEAHELLQQTVLEFEDLLVILRQMADRSRKTEFDQDESRHSA